MRVFNPLNINSVRRGTFACERAGRRSFPLLAMAGSLAFGAACTAATETESGPSALEKLQPTANLLSQGAVKEEDYLPGPGARRYHKSCIHELPAGARLHAGRGDIMVNEQTLQHVSPCQHPPIPTVNGYVEDANQLSQVDSAGYNFFSGLWNEFGDFPVPNAPSSNDGQTLFLWLGLAPADGSTVIQPVLQWGSSAAGGGAFWAMANWYIDSSGNAFFSTPQQVNAGDHIAFTVILNFGNAGCNADGTNCNYLVQWEDHSVAQPTLVSQEFDALPNSYQWAFPGVLEAYNVVQCSDYPDGSSGVSTFGHVLMSEPDGFTDSRQEEPLGFNPSPVVTANLSPACNYAASAMATGTQGYGAVTLDY